MTLTLSSYMPVNQSEGEEEAPLGDAFGNPHSHPHLHSATSSPHAIELSRAATTPTSTVHTVHIAIAKTSGVHINLFPAPLFFFFFFFFSCDMILVVGDDDAAGRSGGGRGAHGVCLGSHCPVVLRFVNGTWAGSGTRVGTVTVTRDPGRVAIVRRERYSSIAGSAVVMGEHRACIDRHTMHEHLVVYNIHECRYRFIAVTRLFAHTYMHVHTLFWDFASTL